MVRWNVSRKDMTPNELTEHKRVLKQQTNRTYYKKRKLNAINNNTNTTTTNNTNNTTNTNDNDNINDYGLLHGLYELYSITQDEDEAQDIEQLIYSLEHKLNIPLEERFIYNIYNDDNDDNT